MYTACSTGGLGLSHSVFRVLAWRQREEDGLPENPDRPGEQRQSSLRTSGESGRPGGGSQNL